MTLIVSVEELEELYQGMIGQSELPPLPGAYREKPELCGLSPILSVSDHSETLSAITPISKCITISDQGENSDTDINISIFSDSDNSDFDHNAEVKFIKPLSDICPDQNDLCHFVCQVNHRSPDGHFEWFHNNARVDSEYVEKLKVTLIDHDQHACIIIANATQVHAGRWTCTLANAQTSANLTVQPGEKSFCISRR